MAIKTLPKTSYKMGKIVVGSALLVGLSLATMAYAKNPPLKTVESVELDRYLGVWYEVARKPLYFQNKCDRDVSATYTLNENGNDISSDTLLFNLKRSKRGKAIL